MSIGSLEEDIDNINQAMKPLIELKARRIMKLRTEKSKLFIELNSIRKESVQRCDEENMPWFWNINDFGEWLDSNSTKPWCCWNGCLYRTSEIVGGRMDCNATGMYEDLSS